MNPIPKKNNGRIVKTKSGRPFLLPSKNYTDYEKNCAPFILPKKPGTPIDEKVNVETLFFRKDKRRVDISNLFNAIHDVLVEYDVISDDNFNIVGGVDGSRVEIDKENPRTEIRITKMA